MRSLEGGHEELRGFATADQLVGGRQLAFLTFYYDTLATYEEPELTPVEFRVWEASTGVTRSLAEVYYPDFQSPELGELTMSSLVDQASSVFTPLLINTTSKATVSMELAQGWNWVSVPLWKEDVADYLTIQEAFGSVPDGDIAHVKEHNAGVLFSDGSWRASAASTVDVGARYEVKMKSGEGWTMTNSGYLAAPTDNPEYVLAGWSELGFLPPLELPLEEAMRGASEEEGVVLDGASLGQGMLFPGDVVLSRYDGFAAYLGDGNWTGSLNVMRPGQGYRIYAPRAADACDGEPCDTLGSFVWPSIGYFGPHFRSAIENEGGVNDSDAPWSMDVREKRASVSCIIEVKREGNLGFSLDDRVGAFVQDADGVEVCVGQTRAVDSPQGMLYFLTMYGELADESVVSFKYFSSVSGEVYLATETMLFDGPSLRGSLQQPVVLSFARDNSLYQDVSGLVAYPNPFDDELVIQWNGTHDVELLRLEDVRGRLVRLMDCDLMGASETCRINTSNLLDGVYLVRAWDGVRWHTVRVIK